MLGTRIKEFRRKRAVRRLDARARTAADTGFGRLVENAAESFNAPIALLSLIGGNRLWVGTSKGFDHATCLPRDDSFCAHVIDRPDLLEVCDPAADERFRNLPGVTGAPFIRYYIGAPLRLDDGTDIGVLCVLDTRRRQPASADQRAYLKGLARHAVGALEFEARGTGALAA